MTWLGLDIRWAYGELLPAIRQRIQCGQRAQDVLHESFVRYAGVSTPIAEPHAYLRRVADHVLADHWRDAARYSPLVAEADASPASVSERLAPSPEQIADQRERLQALQQVLDQLPTRARQVFWMFRIEGRRQQEIAKCLGISRNMVERHVMRALVDLRAARALLDE